MADFVSTEPTPELSPSMSGNRRGKVWVVIPTIVSVGVLALIFWRVDWSRLWATLQMAQVEPLLWGFVLYLAVVAVQGWRWHILLRAEEDRWRLRDVEAANFLAMFFDLITPAKLGSDGYRLVALRAGNRHQLVSTLLGLRLQGLAATAIVALVLTFVYADNLRPLIIGGIVILGILGLLFVKSIAIRARAHLARLAETRKGILGRVAGHTAKVGRALKVIAKSSGVMFSSTLLMFAFIVLNSVVLMLAAEAFGMDVSFGRYVWAISLILLAAGLPISVQGRGISEVLAIYTLGGPETSIEQIILAILGKYAIAVIYGLIAGALILARRGRWSFSLTQTTDSEG